MNIAIIGYGLEGESSYRYFSKDPDNKLTICDQNSDLSLPEFSAGQLGDSYLDDLDKFDLIVRTPGIQPRLILEKNPNVSDKITTQLNEFLRVCPSRNLIGVTGTKGKGTTCSLIKSMLEADQKKVVLVGNIGVSMLDSLNEIDEPTYVVLELSSFQLIDLKQTAPSICVCLMVVPEHLNWHAHLNEYIEAKTNLFRHQSEDSVAIYFNASSFSKQIASASPGKKIPYFIEPGAHCINDKILIDNKVICDIDELNILGKHNWQNVCAALTAFWQLSSNAVAAYKGLTSFKGLEHRLEFVDEINDVKYFDDSFGTTPETAEVAIQSFDSDIVLITGGSDKGIGYELLIDTILKSTVKSVICIGTTGKQIAEGLEKRKNDKAVDYQLLPLDVTMPQIVDLAKAKASPGNIVLLSSASASFDMFKDYKDRGNQFKAAVQALATAA